MFHHLTLLVLLSIAALSSSNVVQPLPIHGPEYDNIYVKNRDSDKLFNIICEGKDESKCKILAVSNDLNTDNNLANIVMSPDEIIDKEYNYNGEGFRQEQWHNYPRQLDRLQVFPYERHKIKYDDDKSVQDNGNSDNDSNFNGIFTSKEQNMLKDPIESNELFIDSNEQLQNIYDKLMKPIDPFFILKIQLSSLSQSLADKSNTRTRVDREVNSESDNEEWLKKLMLNDDSKESNPEIQSVDRIGRDIMALKDAYKEGYWQSGEAKTKRMESVPVKKRLFSLWSRLQNMAPRGHELHHRRHLHAFMHLPGGTEAGGTLTAEARAVMRPPGSPLRWG